MKMYAFRDCLITFFYIYLFCLLQRLECSEVSCHWVACYFIMMILTIIDGLTDSSLIEVR